MSTLCCYEVGKTRLSKILKGSVTKDTQLHEQILLYLFTRCKRDQVYTNLFGFVPTMIFF